MAEKTNPTLNDDLVIDLGKIGVKNVETVIKEFDLLTVPNDAEDLVRETAKKIRERVEAYAHLLEEILQPDASLAAMNECSFFSEAELASIEKMYRRLMAIIRHFTLADLEGTEPAEIVLSSLKAWEREKAGLLRIAKTLSEGWQQDEPLQREHGYFG